MLPAALEHLDHLLPIRPRLSYPQLSLARGIGDRRPFERHTLDLGRSDRVRLVAMACVDQNVEQLGGRVCEAEESTRGEYSDVEYKMYNNSCRDNCEKYRKNTTRILLRIL